MKRLLSALHWDALQQYRYKFYAVGVGMVIFWGGLFSLVPGIGRVDAVVVVPAFFAINLYVTTFYFISGLVLIEKSEGTLSALAATPLRDAEYLLSKVITLTVLAIVESLLIVVVVLGIRGNWVPLLSGAFALGAIYSLAGFIVVVRYRSINAFLIPSVLYVIALLLPLLSHFGLANRLIFLLHPMEPAMELMRAAYLPTGVWEMVYAAAGAAAWMCGGFFLARWRIYRFVVREAGV
ncbi:MAG: ABC transporter permease [Gemmatimonadota bacterium]|nr:ABC transporter permease [Gemmatimonadota bacterium]